MVVGTLREVPEGVAGKVAQRGEHVLLHGMQREILVLALPPPMAACQGLLHLTMVVHRLRMVALANFLVLPSSATDQSHQAMHMQVLAYISKGFPRQSPGSRACIACAAAVQLALSYQCEGCVSHQACCNVDDLVCCSLFHAAAHGGNRRSPAEEVLGTAASTYGCFVSTQNMQVALCRVCRLPCLVLHAENAGQPVALMLKQVDQ